MQESGISMNIQGHMKQIFGTVAIISADNLASNACGGFKEGSTAYRFCRQCLATMQETKSVVSQLYFAQCIYMDLYKLFSLMVYTCTCNNNTQHISMHACSPLCCNLDNIQVHIFHQLALYAFIAIQF